MQFLTPFCPHCGGDPHGAVESVLGISLLVQDEQTGEFDYAGETRIAWDSQEALPLGEPDRVTLCCVECAGDWTTHLLAEDPAP